MYFWRKYPLAIAAMLTMAAAAVLLFTPSSVMVEEGPPVYSETTGMRLARDGEPIEDSMSATSSTARVMLPTGYKFMYIIPAEEARQMNPFWKLQNVYVVRLANGEGRIEFLQAGGSPGSWNVVLTIDER